MSSGYNWTVPGAGAATTTPVGERNNQQARFWGRDLWLDTDVLAGRADVITTPAGDLRIAEGRQALRQALIRRIITAPGDYALLPNYGAGARLYVKERNTQANRDELAERIRAQMALEPRVERVEQVVVSQLEDTQGISINVQVIPKGAARPEDALQFVLEGRAA